MEIWDLSTGVSSSLPKKTGKLWGRRINGRIQISPDGSTVARSFDNRTLTIWNIASGTMKEMPGGHSNIRALAYSPDGKQVASDGTIQIWDAATALCNQTFENPDVETMDISFSSNCRWLAATSSNGLALWDIETGECRILGENHTNGTGIAFPKMAT